MMIYQAMLGRMGPMMPLFRIRVEMTADISNCILQASFIFISSMRHETCQINRDAARSVANFDAVLLYF